MPIKSVGVHKRYTPMHPTELAKQCAESINWNTTNGFGMESASICITTPKGWKAPPRFPRGRIVQWHEDGTRVRYLPAANVLAWLAANFPEQVKIKGVVNGQSKEGSDGGR